jgi:hypothetical protein
MHWIYILRCEEDYFYVGETSRLYRRFWEHIEGNGGLNTLTYPPEEIVAIYKVNTICKFIDYNEHVSNIVNDVSCENYVGLKHYFNDEEDEDDEEYFIDNLGAENNITECLMIHKNDEWTKIRGGKYTRFDVEYKFPQNDYVKDLPLCKCELPCDVKKNEDNNYLYFRCAKKNMWNKLKKEFDTDEPCNFYIEYTKDKQLKIEQQKKFEERRSRLKELFKKSLWLKNIEIIDEKYLKCVGGCNRTSESIKLSYTNKKRNLCFDCFIEKNEELANKYNNQNIKQNNDVIKKNAVNQFELLDD